MNIGTRYRCLSGARIRTCPNWKKAFGLLHPKARATTTLDQFNRQEWERLKGKRDSLCEARVQNAKIMDDTATVSVTLRFGSPMDRGQNSRVVTTLKRTGDGWAVVATSNVEAQKLR